jgi:flavodoxin
MKTVVVYYSRYGNSRVAAKLIARQLGAPVHNIEVKRQKGVFESTFSALFSRRPKIKSMLLNPQDWDMMVLVAPIWVGKPATPVKTFLADTKVGDKRIAAFFSYTTTIPADAAEWLKRVLAHFGAHLIAVGGYDTSVKNHTVLKQRVWEFLAQLPSEAIPAPSVRPAQKKREIKKKTTRKGKK